ncbi:hypothetical protein AKH05_23045 [Vibrio parahaemolyticus]|uniref:hypothetical protein n=1 Tax=Vibrio parahaemolyticus TaxID=670 RepID=UPI0008137DC9|nr:hypothetical protein [Vibrio parahaemolyticus]EKA4470923.1 hypothetical protein [Vibrio parahaemolyticus]OCP52558.1 hypothetical protein AKH05_23045 [Vibrio parahaemolyticus]
MEKYLYLTEVDWASNWINGGDVPISVASTYLSAERDGIYTPDENLIHDSSTDLKSLSPLIHLADGAQVRGLTVVDCSFNGKKVPDIIDASYYTEDGLILSFCNEYSIDIAKRMGKKCCVKILNVEKLRKIIDKQLGRKGKMADCRYTTSHQRNHFLKSNDDSWQNEYRLFWDVTENKIVRLPPGIAELVATFEL